MSGRNPSVKLVELDVTTVNGQTVLLQTLLSANIAYFHGAPPCGTASKARDKPLPSYMEHIKAEPLRSFCRVLIGLGPKQQIICMHLHCCVYSLWFFVVQLLV